MIAIIDYGVGNLFSLQSSLRMIGEETIVTADPQALCAADRLILPGVGAFGDAMARLEETGLDRVIKRLAAQIPSQKIGTFDTELVEEFFTAFERSAGATLHIRQLDGANSHHIVEAMFKAFGRALSAAVAIDARLGGEIPSTKGVLV